jgi:tape measure domain-containing protein
MADIATLTVTLTGQVAPLQRALAVAERDTSRTLGALQAGATGAGRALGAAMSNASTTVTVALKAVQAGAHETGGALSGALAAGASTGRAALSVLGNAAQGALGALGGLAAKAGGVATGALRSLGRVAEYAAGQIVAMGVAASAAQIRQALGEYADYERLSASLQALVARELLATGQAQDMASAMQQAAGRANELRRWIEQLAIESPFSQEDVANSFKTALAYGFTTQEAQRLARAMIDFAAATGASGAVMDRVALALGQIKARGKLAGGELLQLTEAGLDVRDALARSLGKSRQEIEAMIEAGIDADTAISAIVGTLERDFSGAAKRQANTFAGLLSTLTDVRAVLRRSLLGPAFRAAQPALERFVSTLQEPRTIARVEALGERLGRLTARAIELGQAFLLNQSLSKVEQAIAATGARLRRAAEFAADLARGVISFGRALIQSDAVDRVVALARGALGALRALGEEVIELTQGALTTLQQRGLSGLLAFLAQAAGDALGVLIALARERVIPAAISLIAEIAERVREYAPRVLAGIADAVRDAVPAVLSTAGRTMASAGELLLRALDGVADRAGDWLIRAADAMAARAPELLARAQMVDWGGLLKRYLLGGAETPEQVVEWALRAAIVAAGGLLGGMLAGPAGAVAGGLLARWLIDLPAVRDLIGQASSAVVSGARTIADRLREISQSPIWSQIAERAQGIFARVGELAAPFVERTRALVERAGGMLGDFFARNQERFERIGQNFLRIIEDVGRSPIWQTLYDVALRSFEFVAGLIERGLDALLKFADVVLALLAGDFNQVGELMKRFAESAIGFVRYLIESGASTILRNLRDLLVRALELLTPFLAGIVGSLRMIPGAEQLFGQQIADAERAILGAPQALRAIEIAPMSQWQMPQINLTINAPSTDAREIVDEAMRSLRLAMSLRP